jgi:hypothetical protein
VLSSCSYEKRLYWGRRESELTSSTQCTLTSSHQAQRIHLTYLQPLLNLQPSYHIWPTYNHYSTSTHFTTSDLPTTITQPPPKLPHLTYLQPLLNLHPSYHIWPTFNHYSTSTQVTTSDLTIATTQLNHYKTFGYTREDPWTPLLLSTSTYSFSVLCKMLLRDQRVTSDLWLNWCYDINHRD